MQLSVTCKNFTRHSSIKLNTNKQPKFQHHEQAYCRARELLLVKLIIYFGEKKKKIHLLFFSFPNFHVFQQGQGKKKINEKDHRVPRLNNKSSSDVTYLFLGFLIKQMPCLSSYKLIYKNILLNTCLNALAHTHLMYTSQATALRTAL